MHEAHLMKDLIGKIETVARDQEAKKVVSVKVTLGALSHFTKEHFQEHFDFASPGTLAEGARLDMTLATDLYSPAAQTVQLESVEVEK